MTITGRETLDTEFQPYAITLDVEKKLIEDYITSVEAIFTEASMVADYFFASDICSLGEVKMRHNSAQSVLDTIKKIIERNRT